MFAKENHRKLAKDKSTNHQNGSAIASLPGNDHEARRVSNESIEPGTVSAIRPVRRRPEAAREL